MKKKMAFALIGLLVVGGLIAGIKFLQIRKMMIQGAAFAPPPETVTAAPARFASWEERLTAIASLEAVQGVTVAVELPGKVVAIAFEPGVLVQQGDLLVQQDVSTEKAQLPGAEAAVTLTRSNLERNRQLLADTFISQSEFDDALASYREALSAVEEIRATIAKKTIRAPFTGHLGIRQINLGQMLKEGDPVVSLQQLDPMFVNFDLPQQQLPLIGIDLPLRVATDALPGEVIAGTLTAINPKVDPSTRTIAVQGTVANPDRHLHPGMFGTVTVVLPTREAVLTIPATAVLYAPYGDSVFIIEEQIDPKSGKGKKVLRQQFVKLGQKRGDFVAVVSGVKEGEEVVTTGVFKLRNGQEVVIDNTLAPEFKLEPRPVEE